MSVESSHQLDKLMSEITELRGPIGIVEVAIKVRQTIEQLMKASDTSMLEKKIGDLSPLEYAKGFGVDSASLSELSDPSDNGWIELEVTVDSGACDTVMPLSSCDFQILPSYQSKNKMKYEAANGAPIANLGERRCLIRTPGAWNEKRITFQVADVHKPLLSISRAADAGFDCFLNDKGGWLIPRDGGERIPIRRKGNLYVLTMWVKPDLSEKPDNPKSASGFTMPR